MHLRFSIFVVACGSLAASHAVADPVELKIGAAVPEGSPWAEVLHLFETRIEKATKNQIDVKIELRATGSEDETATLVVRGHLQGLLVSGGGLSAVVPELKAIEMPFLFRSAAEVDRVLDNLTTPVAALFQNNGLVFGFWNENGFQQLGTRFPVRKAADFDGKAMNTSENPVNVELWRTLKAKPTPTIATEVHAKLDSGELDGFDQTLLFAVGLGWHTSVQHVTLSYHIYQPAVVAYNKKWFDALSPDLQKVLLAEGKKLTRQGRAIVRKFEPKTLKALKAAHVKVQPLAGAERTKLEAAMKPVRTAFKSAYSEDASKLLEKIDTALGRRPR